MFIKHASVQSIATATFVEDGLKKIARGTAPEAGEAISSPVPKSYYIDGARKVDVRGMLKAASNKYAISADPSHYIYECIRANSTNVPNENHDAFHKNELLRFDTRHAMPVYMTYTGKPHHLNHKTDDPLRARGVILDAHYNDDAPALEHCPTCNHRTAEESGRDLSGIHCSKCATVVKDEFVEILVAVDGNKDPRLVREIQAGALNAGSMGCFLPGTPVTLADGTRIPIEDVRAGDRVLTHTGRTAEVLETSVHEHEDDVYRIDVQGLQAPIVATGNHPFWVVDPETSDGRWCDADKLTPGAFLRCPAMEQSRIQEHADVQNDFARLVGYFISEGNYIKAYDGPHKGKRVGLEFSFSIEEQRYVDEVVSLLRKYGNDPSVYTRPTRNITVIKDYRCIDLVERMFALVGQHAIDKTLSSEIFEWPREAQLHFIGTWLNGDGYSIHDAKHSWSGITTASVNLRDQLSQLLANLGIPHRLRFQPSSFGGRMASEIVVSGNPQLELAAYSDKIKRPHGVVGKVATLTDSKGLLRKIKAVTAESYEGPVYNFEVDDDDRSYIAGGVAVHNCNCASTSCNVCQHVARSVNEFCEHIRGSAKGSLWAREASKDGKPKFVRTSADKVKSMLKSAAWKAAFDGNQLVSVSLTIPERNFEVRKAFEYCQGVEFDEYSRVHRPADPKARSIEILKAAESESPFGVTIDQETEQLIIRARLAQKVASMPKAASADDKTFYAVRVNGNDEDIHISASLEEATKAAQLGVRDRAEYMTVEAPSSKAALTRAITASLTKSAQYLPMSGDVNFVVPDGVKVHLDQSGNPSMPPGAPGPGGPNGPNGPGGPAGPGGPQPQPSIEDMTQQQMAPSEPQQSPEEFGMLPPGASSEGLDASAAGGPQNQNQMRPGGKSEEQMQHTEQKYAAVYGDFEVEVFSDKAILFAPDGEVFTVKAEKTLGTNEAMHQFGGALIDSVMADGLVRTALKFKGEFSKRLADSTEGAMFDMAGGRPMSSGGSLEGHMEAQREGRQEPSDIVKAPGATKDYDDDMQASRPSPANSIESRDTDMADEAAVASPKTNAVDGHEEPQREKRPSYSQSDDGLAGGTTDMKANAGGDSSPKVASASPKVVAQPTSEPKTASQDEVKKALERQRKLHVSQMEKQAADHVAEKASLEKLAVAKVCRAIRIAQKRASLNLETSPLKAKMLDSLTVPRPMGRSASTGLPLEYVGIDDGFALHLVEAAWADSANEEIEALLQRAAELMEYDDKYLISAEKDLSKQAAVIPQVTFEDQLQPVDPVQRRAAALRAEANGGNMTLAPGMTDSGAPGEDKADAIRAALGPTRVGRLLSGAPEDFRPSA